MEIFLGDITIGENEINAGSLSIPLVKGDKGDKRRPGYSRIEGR